MAPKRNPINTRGCLKRQFVVSTNDDLTQIRASFGEFRGKGSPTDRATPLEAYPGDTYIDLTPGCEALYAYNDEWRPWLGPSVRNEEELVKHPMYSDRYLWCNPVQSAIGWLLLGSVEKTAADLTISQAISGVMNRRAILCNNKRERENEGGIGDTGAVTAPPAKKRRWRKRAAVSEDEQTSDEDKNDEDDLKESSSRAASSKPHISQLAPLTLPPTVPTEPSASGPRHLNSAVVPALSKIPSPPLTPSIPLPESTQKLRCPFCRSAFIGRSASDMWNVHVKDKHDIIMPDIPPKVSSIVSSPSDSTPPTPTSKATTRLSSMTLGDLVKATEDEIVLCNQRALSPLPINRFMADSFLERSGALDPRPSGSAHESTKDKVSSSHRIPFSQNREKQRLWRASLGLAAEAESESEEESEAKETHEAAEKSPKHASSETTWVPAMFPSELSSAIPPTSSSETVADAPLPVGVLQALYREGEIRTRNRREQEKLLHSSRHGRLSITIPAGRWNAALQAAIAEAAEAAIPLPPRPPPQVILKQEPVDPPRLVSSRRRPRNSVAAIATEAPTPLTPAASNGPLASQLSASRSPSVVPRKRAPAKPRVPRPAPPSAPEGPPGITVMERMFRTSVAGQNLHYIEYQGIGDPLEEFGKLGDTYLDMTPNLYEVWAKIMVDIDENQLELQAAIATRHSTPQSTALTSPLADGESSATSAADVLQHDSGPSSHTDTLPNMPTGTTPQPPHAPLQPSATVAGQPCQVPKWVKWLGPQHMLEHELIMHPEERGMCLCSTTRGRVGWNSRDSMFAGGWSTGFNTHELIGKALKRRNERKRGSGGPPARAATRKKMIAANAARWGKGPAGSSAPLGEIQGTESISAPPILQNGDAMDIDDPLADFDVKQEMLNDEALLL